MTSRILVLQHSPGGFLGVLEPPLRAAGFEIHTWRTFDEPAPPLHAGEIAGLIGQIQDETRSVVAIVSDGAARTEEGTSTVEQTREAFERIDAAIGKMDERISEVSAASSQVASGAKSLQGELSEVAGVAERSTAASQQVSAST